MLKIVGTSLSQLRSSSKAKYAGIAVLVLGILVAIPLSVNLSQQSQEQRSGASGGDGTISGVVFDDKNYNGVLDAGDPGLAKFSSDGFPIVVQLTETGPTIAQPKVTEARVDGDGRYQFENVIINPDNTYTIQAVMPISNEPLYFPTTAEPLSIKGTSTVNFGFGSAVTPSTDIPQDTCSIQFVPPASNASYSGSMVAVVKTNPNMNITQGYYYETIMTAQTDTTGNFPVGSQLFRVYPNYPYKQYVMGNSVSAPNIFTNQNSPELNVKRYGKFTCALSLKNNGVTIWTHTNSAPFDVMQARPGEFYWNGAVPTAAAGCSVDLNVNPSQIASNQTAQINWTSSNVSGNCEASGRWVGTVPPKGSQSSGPPGQLTNEGSYTYTITCKNADNISCSDSAVLTVGSGSTNTSTVTPTPTQITSEYTTPVSTGSAVIALSPESQALPANTPFKVQVFVSSNAPVNVAQATINFPTSRATLVSINTTESDFAIKAQENVSGGVITIARATQKPVVGMNLLAELTFKPISGPIPLTLSDGQVVSSANNQNLSLAYKNAIYSIALPTKTPTPTSRMCPIPPVCPPNSILVHGDPSVTNPNQCPIWSCSSIVDQLSPSVTPQLRRMGDLNQDGVVNLNDLSILLNSFGTNDTKVDLNGDNKVNIFDLSILLSQIRPQ